MEIIQARKVRGIDDVLRHLSTALPDKIKPAKQQHNLYTSLLKYFDEAVDIEESSDFIKEYVHEVLTPVQCNQFLQLVVQCYDEEKYQWRYMWRSTVGEFISRLVQNSYNAGFNDFALNLPPIEDEYSCIGWGLQGTAQNKLRLHVHGMVGDLFTMSLRHASVYLKGNVGCESAYFVRDSDIIIDGRITHDFAVEGPVQNCTFTINGNIRQNKSYIGRFAASAENCVFKTNNRSTLGRFKKDLYPGNAIYFIHKNDREELIRK